MHIYWNRPSWPGTRVTIYTNCFITEFSGKEHGTNKLPQTGRFWEMSKGDTTCLTTSQNPSHWHPSWMSNSCAARKNSESEWLTKDNLETNSITIKLETTSHVTEQSSRVSSLPYCSPPGHPFPVNSLALSTHVSPRTIYFWVLDKSSLSGPGRDPPSCNISIGYCSLTWLFRGPEK